MAGALEVGTLCTVKTYGKVHEGKIAGRGENMPVTHRQPVTHMFNPLRVTEGDGDARGAIFGGSIQSVSRRWRRRSTPCTITSSKEKEENRLVCNRTSLAQIALLIVPFRFFAVQKRPGKEKENKTKPAN